jgi:hypothetical protein
MPVITAARIADEWRCSALDCGHRCEAHGVRYRDGGMWVCLRHMDTAVNEYCGGGRQKES